MHYQQKYKGVPIYGAEVSSVIVNKKISHIDSKTVTDFDIDVTPALTYKQVIAQAGKQLKVDLKPQDDGELMIYKRGTAYILCWRGVVGFDKELLMVFFSANNAQIVARYPTMIDAGAGDVK